MEFVRSIARKVTVLHEGSVLAEGSMDEVQNDPRVIEVYLGEYVAMPAMLRIDDDSISTTANQPHPLGHRPRMCRKAPAPA